MSENLIYGALGALFIVLIWAAILFYKNPSWALSMLLPLITFLIFDSAVLAVGNALGEGELLHVMTQIRVLIRAFTFPLMIAVAYDQGKRSGSSRLRDPLAIFVAWILVIALALTGFYIEFLGLELEYTDAGGMKRYVESTTPSIHYAAVLALVVVAVLGWMIFRANRKPWLLAGALVLLGTLIGVGIGLPSLLLGYTAAIFFAGVLLTETQLIIPSIPDASPSLQR